MSPHLNNAPLKPHTLTPVGEAWIESGLLWHRLDDGIEVTERSASATVETLEAFMGPQSLPAVVDIRGVVFADRAARDVFAREMDYESATAIIVGSRVSQMLGNAYLRMSRPHRPTRMFASPAAARSWALAFAS